MDVCFHLKPISTFGDIHQFSTTHPSSLRKSISYRTDVNKNLIWTSISFHTDVHQYSRWHLSVFILKYSSTLLDVHQLSYRRPSVLLWISISFHKDIPKNLCGRPSAFIQTCISTSVDIHQFSSRHPSSQQTSISYQTDVHQYLS